MGRWYQAKSHWIHPFNSLYNPQNGPKWPLLAALACLTPGGPFFWLDISGSHHWTLTLGCGEVISGQISLDPALLRPLWPSKWAKMAHFQVWLLWLVWHMVDRFFTGFNWISLLDIHIRVWGCSTVSYLSGSSLFTASTALKTGQNGPFWLLWLVWHPLDLSGSNHWTFTLGCGELISGHILLDPAFLLPHNPQTG